MFVMLEEGEEYFVMDEDIEFVVFLCEEVLFFYWIFEGILYFFDCLVMLFVCVVGKFIGGEYDEFYLVLDEYVIGI